MAVQVGELYAELQLDRRPFDRGLDQAEDKARGWSSRVGGVLSSSAGFLMQWGAIAGVALGGFAYATANMASDLAESENKVRVVFGDMADEMLSFTEGSAASLGMSQAAATAAIGTYGNLFTAMEIAPDVAGDMSTSLVTLAADLASFNNMDPTEVLDKLRAGLVGETEPLRTLGVNLNQVGIEAKAMELGLWDGVGTISAAAKAQASYALILEQTTNAQGDFIETSGGMANQQRILSATIADAGVQIGQAFLPIIAEILPMLVEALQGFSAWVFDNMDTIKMVVATAFSVIGEAISFLFNEVLPVLISVLSWIADNVIPHFVAIFSDVGTNVLPGVGDAFTFLTETVIPAVGAVFEWVTTNILPPLIAVITAITEQVLPFLQQAFEFVIGWVEDNMPTIASVVGQVAGAVGVAFGAIAGVIVWAWDTFGPIIRFIADIAFPVLGAAATILFIAIDQAFKLIGGVFEVFGTVASAVFDTVSGIWEGLSDFFSGVFDTVGGVFRGGLNVIIDLVNGFIRFLNGIRIDIPSIGVPGTDIRIGGGAIDPFNIPQIPRLARGTKNFGGGLAWVGEAGPELVAIPRGSQVMSNPESQRFLQGALSGHGPLIGTVYGYLPGDLEREIERMVRRVALEWEMA